MRAERAVVKFMIAASDIWQSHFPRLHRRAQWHIVHELCTRGREGASVGELYGLVKQIFLLDDATVKDRISEISALGLCTLDPADGRIAARTIVIPTPALLDQFDLHLQAMVTALGDAVAEIAVTGARAPAIKPPAVPLSAEQRRLVLHAQSICTEAWLAALERIFEARFLSKARRLEARRNLISTSHRAVLQMAIAHHFGLTKLDDADEGILADQMASSLLQLTGQNFQTTRDHIAHLIELGLLERRRGRSLHVALSPPASVELQVALAAAATQLPDIGNSLMATLPVAPPGLELSPDDVTMVSAPVAPPPDPWLRELVILQPAADTRRLLLTDEPLTIGRQAPSGLLLNSSEISRTHCQLRLVGDMINVTDLRSTNGTFIDGNRVDGSASLRPGGLLQLGPYVLVYERTARPADGIGDSTLRKAASAARRTALPKTMVPKQVSP